MFTSKEVDGAFQVCKQKDCSLGRKPFLDSITSIEALTSLKELQSNCFLLGNSQNRKWKGGRQELLILEEDVG